MGEVMGLVLAQADGEGAVQGVGGRRVEEHGLARALGGQQGSAQLGSPPGGRGGQDQAETPTETPILQLERGWSCWAHLGTSGHGWHEPKAASPWICPDPRLCPPAPNSPCLSRRAAGSGRSHPGPPWEGQLRPGHSAWAGCPGCWPARGSLLPPRGEAQAADPAATHPCPSFCPGLWPRGWAGPAWLTWRDPARPIRHRRLPHAAFVGRALATLEVAGAASACHAQGGGAGDEKRLPPGARATLSLAQGHQGGR